MVNDNYGNSKLAVYSEEIKRAHPENKYFYRPIAITIVRIALIVTLGLEHVVSTYLT